MEDDVIYLTKSWKKLINGPTAWQAFKGQPTVEVKQREQEAFPVPEVRV